MFLFHTICSSSTHSSPSISQIFWFIWGGGGGGGGFSICSFFLFFFFFLVYRNVWCVLCVYGGGWLLLLHSVCVCVWVPTQKHTHTHNCRGVLLLFSFILILFISSFLSLVLFFFSPSSSLSSIRVWRTLMKRIHPSHCYYWNSI